MLDIYFDFLDRNWVYFDCSRFIFRLRSTYVLTLLDLNFNFLDLYLVISTFSTKKKSDFSSKARTARFFVPGGSPESIKRKPSSRKLKKKNTLRDFQLIIASEKNWIFSKKKKNPLKNRFLENIQLAKNLVWFNCLDPGFVCFVGLVPSCLFRLFDRQNLFRQVRPRTNVTTEFERGVFSIEKYFDRKKNISTLFDGFVFGSKNYYFCCNFGTMCRPSSGGFVYDQQN